MIQPKVATLRGDSDQKLEKILVCLAAYPEGATPKMIAYDTSINVNTVKSLLTKSPLIRKKIRGLYVVANGGDGSTNPLVPNLTDWNFHNCILSTTVGGYRGSVENSTLSFGLVTAKFEITEKGNATFRISTDYPLNISSLEIMAYLFRLELSKVIYTSFSNKDILVKTIEFNKDYANLRLDGVKCITIDNLVTQFKAYQKRRGLRFEHKTKVPMSVQNITDMLVQHPNSIDTHVKLQQHTEALERLAEAMRRNTQLLFKLNDKQNEKRNSELITDDK